MLDMADKKVPIESVISADVQFSCDNLSLWTFPAYVAALFSSTFLVTACRAFEGLHLALMCCGAGCKVTFRKSSVLVGTYLHSLFFLRKRATNAAQYGAWAE